MNKFKIPKSPINKGFSFMELMVVVAIIAMLIIASMPVFRNFTRGRNIKEGANMVMSALRKSREAAITYRKNYRTVLDTINQAVAIYEDNDVVNPAENWKKLPDLVNFDITIPPWYVGNNLPNQNHYGAPNERVYWIEFKPSGSLDKVGFNEQKIHLKEESTGDTKLIKVNALTGRIKVE